MKLSVIVPTLDGEVPSSIPDDPRIEVVVVKGVSPVGKARNEGLRRATGEHVAWVDADDNVSEVWKDAIFEAVESSPDVVTIDAELAGWTNRRDCICGVSSEEATIERLRRDVYRDIVRPSALWLYVTRRELWNGLTFDEDVRVAEDYILLPKVLERAKSCVYIPHLLYRYIRNPKSLINTQDFERDLEVYKLWIRRLEEAPPNHRGECMWGTAVSCYWVCVRVALDDKIKTMPGAKECAERCRKIIRRFVPALLREALLARDFVFRERLMWYVRFLTAALDCWWLQKLRRACHGRL